MSRPPKYCLHKPSGRAYVRLDGKRGKATYLGKHGTDESFEKYLELLARRKRDQQAQVAATTGHASTLSVTELLAKYVVHLESYYSKKPRNLDRRKPSLRMLRKRFGHQLAAEFGPKKLKSLIPVMIDDQDWSRAYINQAIGHIQEMFRWGVSEELIPPDVATAVSTVPKLKKGFSRAREGKKRHPVPDDVVDRTLDVLAPIPRDMVRLLRRTGARPSEVFRLRPMDLDRSGDVWVYTPSSHKTEDHGHSRRIYLGPIAQEVIEPYLDRPADAYCFSPAEAEQQRHAERRAKRKTPVRKQARRRKRKPRRAPRERYDRHSFLRLITRACEKHGIPHWSPYQLRHTAGTAVCESYDLETAQVLLGHSRAKVTENYAQLRDAKAKEVMRVIG